jgi:hypothetical protein
MQTHKSFRIILSLCIILKSFSLQSLASASFPCCSNFDSFQFYITPIPITPMLIRFIVQGPSSHVFDFQFLVSINFFLFRLEFVQHFAGITRILSEVPVFCFCTYTNATRFPDPQRPRSTQTLRSSRVTRTSRKATATSSTTLDRRAAIAPSKTSSGKASTEGQALCYGCRSCLVSWNLPLLTHRARYSPKTRTSPNPAALPLVRVILLILLAANPSPAQLLLLATNNTPRLHPRTVKPRHHLKAPIIDNSDYFSPTPISPHLSHYQAKPTTSAVRLPTPPRTPPVFDIDNFPPLTKESHLPERRESKKHGHEESSRQG